MSVLTNISQISGTGSQQNQPTSESIMGKDDFLRLLVTQLRYQDPLNPLDGADFSAQLAQFSSVEQLANIDETLRASLDGNYLLATSINNTLAATIIGKNVLAYGDRVYFNGQEDAKLTFELSETAKQVTVEIVDESGTVRRTLTLDQMKAGIQTISWDGKDDQGAALPEGVYQFRVTAKNSNDEDIAVTTYTSGAITGVRYGSNGAVLMLGQIEIALSDVYEILQP